MNDIVVFDDRKDLDIISTLERIMAPAIMRKNCPVYSPFSISWFWL
ncbi:MAG: hypothetical protein ACP5U0_08185 [Caldisphaera sp.]